MADRLKELLSKILEWWNKFSTKQKTFIISAGAGIILALAILITVLTRTQYVLLLNCETTKQASEVAELLEGEGLNYEVSDDAYQIRLDKDQESQANLLLAANDIQSVSYTIDMVTEGGFSTTEADKQKRYKKYMEDRIANDILSMYSPVERAVVICDIPEQDGTLIATKEDTSMWITLELSSEMSQEMAAGLAKAAAVAVGNETPENIVIMDTEGNILYSGEDSYSTAGSASTQLGVKAQWETRVKNSVRQVLLGTNEYNKVEVAVNLNLDFSSGTERTHEYFVPDGNSQGYLSSSRSFSSSSENSGGDVPGTDTNGEVEYEWRDNDNSSSETTEEEQNYLPSERITDKNISPGVVNYDSSSVSASAITMNIIREEDVEAQGLLDGISWEEYKINNAGQTQIEVPDEIFDVVAKATGFPRENIALVAYSENVFFDKEGLNISLSDIVQIILIVIILALLAFVVLRSMRSEKQEEQPEELSVETLLQSQPEVVLEDISVEKMSETRRLIEKFVDENPEAVANLLRNWLNEE